MQAKKLQETSNKILFKVQDLLTQVVQQNDRQMDQNETIINQNERIIKLLTK